MPAAGHHVPNAPFPYGGCLDRLTDVQQPTDSTLESLIEAHEKWSLDMITQGFIYFSVTGVGMGITSSSSVFKDAKTTEKYLVCLNIGGFISFYFARLLWNCRYLQHLFLYGGLWAQLAFVITAVIHNSSKHQGDENGIILASTAAALGVAYVSILAGFYRLKKKLKAVKEREEEEAKQRGEEAA